MIRDVITLFCEENLAEMQEEDAARDDLVQQTSRVG